MGKEPSSGLNFNYHPKQSQAFLSPANEILFGGATRGGKLLSLDTFLPTPTGGVLLSELKEGDYLLSEEGKPAKVLKLHPIQYTPTAYKLTFDDGTQVTACGEHLWRTFTRDERISRHKMTPEYRAKRRANRPSRKKESPKNAGSQREITRRNKEREYNYKRPSCGEVRTTQEIYDTMLASTGHINHSIQNTKPLDLPERELPIPPYTLGAWLGDGTSIHGGFTGIDPEIWEEIERDGYTVTHYKDKRSHRILGFLPQIRELGVYKNKYIPDQYLRASAKQRLALLQGLMDTDGTVADSGSVEFDNTNKRIVDGIYDLICSFGWKCRVRESRATLYGKDCGPKYRIKWRPDKYVFRLKRKREKQKIGKSPVNKVRFIVSCEPTLSVPMRCITVDNPTNLFLCTKSFIPTHNSYFTRTALICWSTWIDGLQSFIYRKYYDDVITNHMEGPDGFKALLRETAKAGGVKMTENQVRFANGSLITLCHCSTDDAVEKAQGVPKHVLVLEEAPQILERYIRFLRSWVSMPEVMKDKLPEQLKSYLPWMSPEDLRELFPRIIYTGNPTGVSMNYFRRNFVKAAQKGVVFRAPEKEGGFKRQYIEARVEDNPSEDARLVRARVKGLGDDAMSSALLEANWDAPVGDFFPQYDDEVHTCPNFDPPDHWFKFISFDWGSADPFAVLWWCVSDGTTVKGPLGQELWFRRGALIAYREWYGCDPENPGKGLELRNEDIAIGIRDRTREATSGLVITDSAPFADRGYSRTAGSKKRFTIADVFADNGCPLVLGNTSRKYGWGQVRSRLIGVRNGAGVPNDPMILFCESCVHTRDYLPALGRSKTDPEDALDKGEATHLCDCVRLACATKPIVKDAKKTKTGHYRKRHIVTPNDILKSINKTSMSRYARRSY